MSEVSIALLNQSVKIVQGCLLLEPGLLSVHVHIPHRLSEKLLLSEPMHGQGEALNVGIRVFLLFIRVIGKGHFFFIVFVKRDQILHLVSVKVLLHNFVVSVFMCLIGPIVIPISFSGLAVLFVDRIHGVFESSVFLMGLKMHIDVVFKFLSTSVKPTLDINGPDFFKWFHIVDIPEIFLAQLAYSDTI